MRFVGFLDVGDVDVGDRTMKGFGLLLLVLGASLLVGTAMTRALPVQKPGTLHYSWSLRWPAKGQQRVFIKKFRAPPGLMRRVRVLIAGQSVASPPDISDVACAGTGERSASAQKTWLWNGRSVFVVLLLSTGECRVANTSVRVRVALTSVGS
jgi:hypothetical protein